MRRTREWWATLTDDERKWLVGRERYAQDSGPDWCGGCEENVPTQRYGRRRWWGWLCGECQIECERIITKADNAIIKEISNG